ncbi:hypothetical protein F53441_3866 [Fusarium austroafricanum]|uniref:Nucleosomal binding protein n=1 Tax=Fusarium austroafricanum TaxID=2364996 RepID=A0A8H4P2C6_9HYPO|nr:hypothetical protein F53441_3866 [Fusarium austroafricanum]
MPSDAPSEADSTAHHQPPASHRTLRLVAIASFLPAFPLCLVHGILSKDAAPAVGIIPCAFTLSGNLILLRIQGSDDPLAQQISRPVPVFVFDVILAAAYMSVLVSTWVMQAHFASLSMLAAYATMPLLVNFFTHLLLAIQSFYTGLAIHSVVQWIAWRALPPNCPQCDHRLRSDFPKLPWLEHLRPRRQRDYSALFVDDENRYHDEENEETLARAESAAQVAEAQPEVVDVRRKNNRRNRTDTPPSRDEPVSPWGSS